MVDEVLAKYPNDVNVVIKNFPLGSHKQAKRAAQYSLAAHKQGKYKEMYHKIFDNYKSLRNDEDLPKKIAYEMGLDIAQLMKDMNSQEILDLIDWEYNQLASLRNAYPETEKYAAGVRLAIPKFFINGREPVGRSIEQFSIMIDEELKKDDINLNKVWCPQCQKYHEKKDAHSNIIWCVNCKKYHKPDEH